MSVLAHIVDKFSSLQGEPVATQALTHILNSNRDIASAFVNSLMPELMPEGNFQPGLIQAEVGNEGGQPDLTIHDSQGDLRAFVENKFWSGFTENQPVNYLNDLPEGGTLLFIVPEKRKITVWNNLKQRCIAEGHNPQQYDNAHCANVLGKTMRITSWTNVLAVLQKAAQDRKHGDIQCDILQLQELASREDSEDFLPVRPDELTGQEVSRRLVNYCDLVDPIKDQLVANQFANAQTPIQHGWHSAGRYLHIFLPDYLNYPEHQYRVWFGVYLNIWSIFGITPLWLELRLNDDQSNVNGDPGHIKEHFIREEFHGVQYYEGLLYFPIRIMPSVERDDVINHAVEQIETVANILHNLNNPG